MGHRQLQLRPSQLSIEAHRMAHQLNAKALMAIRLPQIEETEYSLRPSAGLWRGSAGLMPPAVPVQIPHYHGIWIRPHGSLGVHPEAGSIEPLRNRIRHPMHPSGSEYTARSHPPWVQCADPPLRSPLPAGPVQMPLFQMADVILKHHPDAMFVPL